MLQTADPRDHPLDQSPPPRMHITLAKARDRAADPPHPGRRLRNSRYRERRIQKYISPSHLHDAILDPRAPRRTRDELGAIFTNGLPVEALDPRDVSNAVLWLASDEAHYVTGAALTVDAGNTIR